MAESSLGHLPGGKWAFDESVTECFDDMLRRSIPQYDVMRETVTQIGHQFTANPGQIIDLGSSRGDAIAPFVDDSRFGREALAYETSAPMAEVLRKRFAGNERVRVIEADLRTTRFGVGPAACLVLSVLTLQFVPINYRQRILRDAFTRLRDGGALVLVEKVLGEGAEIDSMMVSHYHGLKSAHGYGREEIDRKAMALEGVLVPVTARWNEDMLRRAGFSQVDCFWRWMNFAGWVAVKE